MKVLVTGATGFAGSHILRRLQHAGHNVRVLVRDRHSAEKVFADLVIELPEIYEGDVLDVELCRHALAGCDAVVHAASVDQGLAGEADFAVNATGSKNILQQAADLELEFAIYISCLTVLFNTDAKEVVAGAPLAKLKSAWGQSKIQAEEQARDLYRQDFPLAMIYPSKLLGPDAPQNSHANNDLLDILSNGLTLYKEEGAEGGMQHVDVRDLAELVLSVLEKKSRGGHVLAGHYLTWSQQANVIDAVTGARLARKPEDSALLRKSIKVPLFAKAAKKLEIETEKEKLQHKTRWPNIRNSKSLAELGLEPRSFKDSVSDTLVSYINRGELNASEFPRLQARIKNGL